MTLAKSVFLWYIAFQKATVLTAGLLFFVFWGIGMIPGRPEGCVKERVCAL